MAKESIIYKDLQPQETINNIRDILFENNIFLTENWLSKKEGLCVVNLLFNNIKVSSGKGVTPEYALASAYSEFIERLQNNLLIDFDIPDKKDFSFDEFISIDNIYTNKTLGRYLNISENNFSNAKSGKQLEKIMEIIKLDKLSCIPFYNLKENNISYLPIPIIYSFHSSTGMCAGNTPEEALVQGLSEIIERYAAYQIVLSGVLPPIVPPDKYMKYDSIKQNIEYYNKKGYEIEFRDCSLGKNLPVLMLIVFNKKSHTYTTTFSSHPCFNIALERCFTEFRQEKDELVFKNSKLFYKLDCENNRNNVDFDILRSFYEGIIHINWQSYIQKDAMNFNEETWNHSFNTNKEMLNYMIKIVSAISDNIYIRDVSFLGFCSYYILVPELSFRIIDEKVLSYFSHINMISSYFFNYMKEGKNIPKSKIYEFFDMNNEYLEIIKGASIIYAVDNDELAAAYSYVNNDYDKTIEYLENFINKENTRSLNLNKDKAIAIKNYIELKKLKYENSVVINILSKFYDKEIINYVEDFCVNSNPLEKCLLVNQKISDKNNHKNDIKDIISQKLTKKYAENIIQQDNLRYLFIN